jgi:hypothetical protein
VTEDSGAVCRCSVARGFALVRGLSPGFVVLVGVVREPLEISEIGSWVSWPVRSCDAVATVIDWVSFEGEWGERTQKDVIGALCNIALDFMFLE